MDDYPIFPPNYSTGSNVGLELISLFVVILIIVSIILALYFTCSWPFGSLDSCECKTAGGTYADDVCKCSTEQEMVKGVCKTKCASNQIRGTDDVCKAKPVVVTDPLVSFTKRGNQAISGYNKVNMQATTPSDCAKACLAQPWCNSIDFNLTDKSCFLQDNPADTATYVTTTWDNYKRN